MTLIISRGSEWWATKASDLVNGLVPVASGMTLDKVTSVALGGTLLSPSA
jgi:hypothetical protein